MSWLRRTAVVLAAAGVLASCSDDGPCEVDCQTATVIEMDFSGDGGFFGSPFPSDARRTADGRPDISGFPNPQSIVLVERVLDVLRTSARGFGLSSGIFLQASGALDPGSLPSLQASVTASSPVQLIGVDPAAPDYLVRYPVAARFTADGGPYGAPNLLSLVPLQGVPLRPSTRYAAIVTRAVRDASGVPLVVSPAIEAIVRGEAPAGMNAEVFDQYRATLDALAEAGVPVAELAAMTVFTTDDPTAGMGVAIEAARATALPSPNEAFAMTDEFPTFCVYAATIDMPVYQAGEPPYLEVGGGWTLDAQGVPELQREETARFVLTVPRSTMPAAGYPLVVMSRTGGGGDRPLVDRGLHAEPGGEAIEPGTGPALELARVGFAGASVDGPHGGPRNVSGADEQFLVYNFQNPLALRDNIRQSALELALLPEILESVTVDVSGCAGAEAPADTAHFDGGTISIMGHSMGASIAPLALVYEPRYRAAILSGAGGSFLANMIHKQKPIPVKPLAELILGLTVARYELTEENPFVSMLQWAGEPADNPIYGRHVVREPITGGARHVLMLQGVVDHYIMPPIANATSLSFGLDLAGEPLDEQTSELAQLDPLRELLGFAGRELVPLPVQANAQSVDGATSTAVVTQNAEDGLEDGHEVMYQTEGPKHAYACFLESLAAGMPRVPRPGGVGDPCE